MKLSLPEELLLLALDDERGSAVSAVSMTLPYALAGAIVFELTGRGLIEMEGKDVRIVAGVKSGDAVLDLALDSVGIPKKAKSIKWLVSKIAAKESKINAVLYDQLVSKGILVKDDRHFLWVIPYSRYPTKNALPETHIRKRMIDAVLGDGEIAESDYILLSLIKAANLEKEVFPKEILKEAKLKLKMIAENEKIGVTVSAISQEIQTAILVTVIACVVVTNS